MCGECDANNCKYIGTSAGNVPATLYLRPIDPKSCGFLFVKFNTQGNGQNACGPIEADSAEKEFKQQVFLVTEKSVAGCSGNKSTKLNPEIKGKLVPVQRRTSRCTYRYYFSLTKYSFLTKIVLVFLFLFFKWHVLVLMTALLTLISSPSTLLAPNNSITDKYLVRTLCLLQVLAPDKKEQVLAGTTLEESPTKRTLTQSAASHLHKHLLPQFRAVVVQNMKK
jgi:hypothetical protein